MSVHLQTFKKCVVESAKVLFDGEQFISAVDYCIMAWGYVKVILEGERKRAVIVNNSSYQTLYSRSSIGLS